MTKIPSKLRRTNHISQNKFRQNFWLIVWQRRKMDFLRRIELESSYFKATLFAAIPKKFSGQPILDTKYVLKAFLSASLFFRYTHSLTRWDRTFHAVKRFSTLNKYFKYKYMRYFPSVLDKINWLMGCSILRSNMNEVRKIGFTINNSNLFYNHSI